MFGDEPIGVVSLSVSSDSNDGNAGAGVVVANVVCKGGIGFAVNTGVGEVIDNMFDDKSGEVPLAASVFSDDAASGNVVAIGVCDCEMESSTLVEIFGDDSSVGISIGLVVAVDDRDVIVEFEGSLGISFAMGVDKS